jgi:hypothetical protein
VRGSTLLCPPVLRSWSVATPPPPDPASGGRPVVYPVLAVTGHLCAVRVAPGAATATASSVAPSLLSQGLPAAFAAASHFVSAVLIGEHSVSLAEVVRLQRRALAPRSRDSGPTPPYSNNVRAMFSPVMCSAGSSALPPSSVTLSISGFDAHHLRHCPTCGSLGSIAPACYYALLRLTITHGYHPTLLESAVGTPPIPLYRGGGADGNHASVSLFPAFTRASMCKLLARKALEPSDSASLIISPLAVVLPRSQARCTSTLTGVRIRDDASFLVAVAAMGESGLTPPKRRLVHDLRASGVNAQLRMEPFSYATAYDAVHLMTPGCFMGVEDGDAYYFNFQIASAFRDSLGCAFEGSLMRYTSCPFGLASAPYFVSTWSAEMKAYLSALGIPAVVMIDDYFYTGCDESTGLAHQAALQTAFAEVGIPLSADKSQGPKQRAVFNGALLDSVTMSMSINPASAGLFFPCLEAYAALLASGQDLGFDLWRHVAGKLEDFSRIAQCAKPRVGMAWRYLRHGPALWPVCRVILLADLAWWLAHLALWAQGTLTGAEYPIVNAATLALSPSAITVVVTDFSGTDGIGGISGLVGCPSSFFSRCLATHELGISSFHGELLGLMESLRRDSLDPNPPPYRPILTIWVTDSQSAALAVNSGRCSTNTDLTLLSSIFDLAASFPRTILAIWVPRQDNIVADNLSHLASSLSVRSVSGPAAYLSEHFSRADYIRGRGAAADPSQCPVSGAAVQPLRHFLGPGASAPGFPQCSVVRDSLHATERGPDDVLVRSRQPAPVPSSLPRPALPLSTRRGSSIPAPLSVPPQRPLSGQADGSSADVPRTSDHRQPVRLVESRSPDTSLPSPRGSPGPPPHGGGHGGPARAELRLAALSSQRSHPHPCTSGFREDSFDGRGSFHRDGRQPGPDYGLQAPAEAVFPARPPPSA